MSGILSKIKNQTGEAIFRTMLRGKSIPLWRCASLNNRPHYSFKIALLLVCLAHVARFIEHADDRPA
jgi:hypothetical protein